VGKATLQDLRHITFQGKGWFWGRYCTWTAFVWYSVWNILLYRQQTVQ